MTEETVAEPPAVRASATRVPIAIGLLLLPGWIVGLAAIVIALDLTTFRWLREPVSQIFGHTILFGAFLAPPLSFIGTAAAVWRTIRTNAAGAVRLWTLVALSWAGVVAGWAVLFAIFRS